MAEPSPSSSCSSKPTKSVGRKAATRPPPSASGRAFSSATSNTGGSRAPAPAPPAPVSGGSRVSAPATPASTLSSATSNAGGSRVLAPATPASTLSTATSNAGGSRAPAPATPASVTGGSRVTAPATQASGGQPKPTSGYMTAAYRAVMAKRQAAADSRRKIPAAAGSHAQTLPACRPRRARILVRHPRRRLGVCGGPHILIDVHGHHGADSSIVQCATLLRDAPAPKAAPFALDRTTRILRPRLSHLPTVQLKLNSKTGLGTQVQAVKGGGRRGILAEEYREERERRRGAPPSNQVRWSCTGGGVGGGGGCCGTLPGSAGG